MVGFIVCDVVATSQATKTPVRFAMNPIRPAGFCSKLTLEVHMKLLDDYLAMPRIQAGNSAGCPVPQDILVFRSRPARDAVLDPCRSCDRKDFSLRFQFTFRHPQLSHHSHPNNISSPHTYAKYRYKLRRLSYL